METKEVHLTILLDIQKQLGDLKADTVRQNEILSRIDAQVQKTNGRVTKLETDDNLEKGKLTVIASMIAFVASIVAGLIIKYINFK